MDLDELRNIWNKTTQSPDIDDETLLKILKHKGRTALGQLLIFERVNLYLSVLLIAIPFLHNYLFPIAKYSSFSLVWFISFCIILFVWEIIKIKLLKKIDVKDISLLASMKYITRYKRFLQYELFAGLLWFVIFLISFVFPLTNLISEDKYWSMLLFMSFLVVISIVVICLFYKFFYRKNIEKIEDSIREILDFEDEKSK